MHVSTGPVAVSCASAPRLYANHHRRAFKPLELVPTSLATNLVFALRKTRHDFLSERRSLVSWNLHCYLGHFVELPKLDYGKSVLRATRWSRYAGTLRGRETLHSTFNHEHIVRRSRPIHYGAHGPVILAYTPDTMLQRNSPNKFIKNFDFDYGQTRSFFTVTSVSGHLMSHDFPDTHRSWHSCDPFTLFDAPVISQVSNDARTIETNLKQEARGKDMLMIWTDCDREGENIGAEVARVCQRANPNIQVKRARFSAIIAQQIHRAAQHPVELDMAQADAVEARTILDLRIGAAFTRMQTLALQSRVKDLSMCSYGA